MIARIQFINRIVITSAKEVMFLLVFVCLTVCDQDNSKSYGRIFLKFWGYVGHGISYKWFNFGRDPAGILDSGSLWNFRHHCVKKGIREPLQNQRRWRHLANSIALAEVSAGYDCFLVGICWLVVGVGPTRECRDWSCENSGRCVQQWDSYYCDCDLTTFTGPTCADGNTHVVYDSGLNRCIICMHFV